MSYSSLSTAKMPSSILALLLLLTTAALATPPDFCIQEQSIGRLTFHAFEPVAYRLRKQVTPQMICLGDRCDDAPSLEEVTCSRMGANRFDCNIATKGLPPGLTLGNITMDFEQCSVELTDGAIMQGVFIGSASLLYYIQTDYSYYAYRVLWHGLQGLVAGGMAAGVWFGVLRQPMGFPKRRKTE